jgi:hypothetical protein
MIFECVLCGRTTTYRERRWTKKPKDVRKRFAHYEDACQDHFL